jgi:signal transduction histidine kinase
LNIPAIFHQNSRWAWIVCALLLSGFLANSIGDYLVARNNVRQTITESTLPLTSDNVYSEIQRDLLQPIFIASLMASDTFLRDWVIDGEKDESAIVKYLHEIKIKYGTITSFFVSDKTLKYYYAHGLLKTVGADEPRDEWYFRVRDMEAPYEINVDPDMANRDEMTIFINYRTQDYAGNFIGATGVGLTVNKVNHLISSYEAKYARQIYFVDSQGKIVLRPSNSPMLEYASLQEIEGLSHEVGGLLAGRTNSLTYRRDGENRILNSRFVPELDWFLIVEQSEEALLAPLRQQLSLNILIALGMTALIGCICIYVIRSHKAGIEKRNRELTQKAQLIDEQKQALKQKATELESTNEQLQALNHEKDEFLGIVAHDLRNPLNSIIGLSEITLEDVSADSPSAEALTHISKSGHAMNNLIGELLNVSRIEAYQATFEPHAVAWNPLIETVAGRFEKDAAEKHIQLNLELTESAGITVNGIDEWLSIIIDNLLSNAIKFSPPYGKVTIRTTRTAQGIETRFEDSGPGIKSEEQGKLFQKFVRLSAKPTGNEHSTGLGLYIVKKMCDRLGIDVRVKSELGEGATFILTQSA